MHPDSTRIKPLAIWTVVEFCLLFACISPLQSQTPTQALHQFTALWCLTQALAVVLNFTQQARWYDWFVQHDEDLGFANRRGFGCLGYRLFSVIALPALPTVRWVGAGYILGLLSCGLACAFPSTQLVPLALVIWPTLTLQLLWFASLYLERTASYHRAYLAITLMMYLAMAPAFYSSASNAPDAARDLSSAWILWLIKVHIGSVYCVAGLQKVIASILQQEWWPMHSPHKFVWNAYWAAPLFPALQRFLLCNPRLMALGGHAALAVELFFFLALDSRSLVGPEYSDLASQVVAVAVVGMHGFIYLAQGIDYISHWCPALLVWCVQTSATYPWQHKEMNGFSWEIGPAIGFCAIQVTTCCMFAEAFNINCPPFTSSPMFNSPDRVLAGRSSLQWLMLTDPSTSTPLENMQWWLPFAREDSGLGLAEKAWQKIPFRYIGFGYETGNGPSLIPGIQDVFLRDEVRQGIREGFIVRHNIPDEPHTNLDSLILRLRGLVLLLNSSPETIRLLVRQSKAEGGTNVCRIWARWGGENMKKAGQEDLRRLRQVVPGSEYDSECNSCLSWHITTPVMRDLCDEKLEIEALWLGLTAEM